jgi:hypothetical protein
MRKVRQYNGVHKYTHWKQLSGYSAQGTIVSSEDKGLKRIDIDPSPILLSFIYLFWYWSLNSGPHA